MTASGFDTATLDALLAAPVAVFAWCNRAGEPRSCAVTPYVVDGHAVVTSTLALPTKAAATRRDPRVALLAGGYLVQATAHVGVDRTSNWFDRNLRVQELQKYPAGRALLAIPGHRRLVPWYVGRVVITLADADTSPAVGPDHTTVTVVVDGRLRIAPIPDVDPATRAVSVPPELEGPADLLVHEESDDFAELRQLHRRGTAANGTLTVDATTGSLEPGATGSLAQLCQLRELARSARRHRAELAAWPPPAVG